MLVGHLSNQDEEEVEDELEALHREVEGPASLPNAPTTSPKEDVAEEEPTRQEVRTGQRARERPAIPAS